MGTDTFVITEESTIGDITDAIVAGTFGQTRASAKLYLQNIVHQFTRLAMRRTPDGANLTDDTLMRLVGEISAAAMLADSEENEDLMCELALRIARNFNEGEGI